MVLLTEGGALLYQLVIRHSLLTEGWALVYQ